MRIDISKITLFLTMTFITSELYAAGSLEESGISLASKSPVYSDSDAAALAGTKRRRSSVVEDVAPVITELLTAPTKSKSVSKAALSRLATPKVRTDAPADATVVGPYTTKKSRPVTASFTAPVSDRLKKPVSNSEILDLSTIRRPLTSKAITHKRAVESNEKVIAELMGPAPTLDTIAQFKRIDQSDMIKLLQKSLVKKFGRGQIFTMPNRQLTFLLPKTLEKFCTKIIWQAPLANFPNYILNEHRMDYVIGDLNRDIFKETYRKLDAQYLTLSDAIKHMDKLASSMNYQYVTIDQADISGVLKQADEYFKRRPDITLVLTATEGKSVLALRAKDIPASLKKLTIIGAHVKTLDPDFLEGLTNLTEIDLTPLLKNGVKISPKMVSTRPEGVVKKALEQLLVH